MTPSAAISVSPLRADEDLSALGEWLADPRMARGLNIVARQLSPTELSRYVGSFDGDTGIIMGIRMDSRLVGVATFDINRRHDTAQWNLIVGDRRARAMHNLLEAGLYLFDWALGAGGFAKVSCRVAANKLVLVRFHELMGVRQEGYFRGELLLADGITRQDEVSYGLLASEWPAIRRTIVAHLPHLAGKS